MRKNTYSAKMRLNKYLLAITKSKLRQNIVYIRINSVFSNYVVLCLIKAVKNKYVYQNPALNTKILLT